MSQRRTALAQIETIACLTVQWWWFLIVLTSSSDSWPKVKRRCGEMRPLRDVRGAVYRCDSRATSLTPRIRA
jgi:hypothetical protein